MNGNRGNQEPGMPPNYWRGAMLWILLFLFLIAAGLWGPCSGQYNATQITYTEFLQEVRSGNVQTISMAGDKITGQLKKAEKKVVSGQALTYQDFVTFLPSIGDPQLLPLLEQKGVVVDTKPSRGSGGWDLMIGLLPFVVLIFLGILLFRRLSGGAQTFFSMNRSQARLYERRKERTTFNDVAGARGAKVELQEIIEFLKTPKQFQLLGGKIPRGVLLAGPPGTGKTLLARAVAGEADVPFFSTTGSTFMEMFVGVGASRVRNMFAEAKKVAPGIIFIDELDSIGRRRGMGIGGGHDEREQTLNQLLSEMDGFEPNESVIVMAATNRPDVLDPALLRPGRFDRRITVDLPTLEDRLAILKIHARNKPIKDTGILERVARGTPGFSGADLENLLNEAALLAARKGKKTIDAGDVDQAEDKVVMGLERENLGLTREECRLLSYHEGGHSVVAAVLPHTDPIRKVTIVPRGRAMGVTQQLPEKDKYLYSREYMLDRLAVMMGGRAAEELVLATSTSGAEADLKQATNLARKMVLDWGMSEKLENVALGSVHEDAFLGDEAWRRNYSERTAWEVDEEVRKILNDAYERAMEALRQNREGLDKVAQALQEKEEIQGDEVLQLVGVEQRKIPLMEPQAHSGCRG